MLPCNQSFKAIGRIRKSTARHQIGISLVSSKTTIPWRPWQRSIHPSRPLQRDETVSSGVSSDFISAYKDSLFFPPPSCEIRDLEKWSLSNSGEVVLHGYLGVRRDLSKNFFFVELRCRDLRDVVQIVSRKHSNTENIAHDKLKTLEPYTPVVIKGILNPRKPKPSSAGSLTAEPDEVSVGHGKSKAERLLTETAEEPIAPLFHHPFRGVFAPIISNFGKGVRVRNVEITLRNVQPLNDFPKDVIITPDTVFPPEQRHLQLRTDRALRDALEIRDRAVTIARRHLALHNGFTEVETPILFKSTPEGAREFIVPTRRKGLAYALPQSPQQYKQILMASGVSRYFQLARCFRDEDLRADRQPEFTQLDLEMSFATGKDVMDCVEGLVKLLWLHVLGIKLKTFPTMHYNLAISRYGSDKPDLRFNMPMQRVGEFLPASLISKITPLSNPVVQGMVLHIRNKEVTPREVRKFLGEFMDSADALPFNNNPDGAPGIFVYDTSMHLQGLQAFEFSAADEIERRFQPSNGDIIVIQACKEIPKSGGSTPFGRFRIALHEAAVAARLDKPSKGFEPLWITDFPLFSPSDASEPRQGGAAGLASTHHPFTSPKTAKDMDCLLSDPTKVVGDHYDLVINGVELGGGSRRIHNSKMQRFILEDILKMRPERIEEFAHLLEALRAGCPPHAGMALGFDRLIALMLGKDSVRDVIAFPKSGKGEDMLVKSPGPITQEVRNTYHLKYTGTD